VNVKEDEAAADPKQLRNLVVEEEESSTASGIVTCKGCSMVRVMRMTMKGQTKHFSCERGVPFGESCAVVPRSNTKEKALGDCVGDVEKEMVADCLLAFSLYSMKIAKLSSERGLVRTHT
jgi:hypothetical protein